MKRFAPFLIIVVAALGVFGLWLRRHLSDRDERARRVHVEARGPRVLVAPVTREPAQRRISLPADVRAFRLATLYAKTAGYLRRIYVDKGDPVKRNQKLAVVSSPETDHQVEQARANAIYQERDAVRARFLASREFIAQRDLDTVEASRMVAEASLKQIRSLQNYQVVRAPYDGVITNRYVDPGALIPAATGGTASAVPLVDVSDLTRVKLLVYPSQDVATHLKVGDPVTIGDQGEARISRLTSSLDPRSRTMLVEIWLDNSDRRWVPGAWTTVTLQVTAPPLARVPSSALITRGGKLLAAVVDDGKVHLVPVAIGTDDGKNVQIKSGLDPGQKVALNLPAELGDGAAIQPVDAAK